MNCCEVHACDIDDRILSINEVEKEITEVFGKEALKQIPGKYLREIHYKKCSITKLPYEEKKFNKIYCISVLEHLNDTYNKWPAMYSIKILDKFLKKDIYLTLKEFNRTLKDDGLIFLTFDYPRINFTYLKKILPDIGLKFADEVYFDIPKNALKYHELFFFRAVLKKQCKL